MKFRKNDLVRPLTSERGSDLGEVLYTRLDEKRVKVLAVGDPLLLALWYDEDDLVLVKSQHTDIR